MEFAGLSPFYRSVLEAYQTWLFKDGLEEKPGMRVFTELLFNISNSTGSLPASS